MDDLTDEGIVNYPSEEHVVLTVDFEGTYDHPYGGICGARSS
jgi:hypothetical protein